MSAVVVMDNGALAAFLNSPDGPVGRELMRRTLSVERAAKGYAPVDTGRLRASITSRLATDSQGLVGIVGTDVEYAIFQEFGTRYQRGTPFLRPAVEAAGA